ncbi:hypothetical protein [Streptomyces sp. KL116D]|uniref:hypothetical protein n=1 Tax=Streptomyces sp. KL116D TaxID=3045152 RepID=UPI00355727C4
MSASGVRVRVLTQNVDGAAPARRAARPQGALNCTAPARRFVCTECGGARRDGGGAGPGRGGRCDDPGCPLCGGILKSTTVMFGERVDPVVLAEAVSITRPARCSSRSAPASRCSPRRAWPRAGRGSTAPAWWW